MPETTSPQVYADNAQTIENHAQMLASGTGGPYDRYMVLDSEGHWVEVTEKVREIARSLGWSPE